jgi:hypothetical protein
MRVKTKRVRSLCPHCNQPMPLKHKHTLSDALVTGLARLRDAGGGPMNLKHLQLTRNQWDNFQKLRYWDLVQQSFDPATGSRQSGVWEITPKGVKFLAGIIQQPKAVWTVHGETVEVSDEKIYAPQGELGYRTREDYATDSRRV